MRKIRGRARVDPITKNLVQRARAGEIAVIDHADIDELAAVSLVRKGVVAVLDCAEAATGRYPAAGPSVLLDARVHLVDNLGREFMECIREGEWLEVRGSTVSSGGRLIGKGRIHDRRLLEGILRQAEAGIPRRLDEFFRNTLERAEGECKAIVDGPPDLALKTHLNGRHVLVVARGKAYQQDLRTILPYIREVRPVLVAVDGGADALLEMGFKPNIILGDMDSVSDLALRSGAELVVHAYSDGNAPGLGRLRAMNLPATSLPCPGTSEDAALLLAHAKGASLIVAVGTHSNFIDFQEKGRAGMASTLLVRAKVGPTLVDAKGVSQLYQARAKPAYFLEMALAALLPLAAIATVSPWVQDFLRLAFLRARMALGF